MALIKCSECGREISDKATVCPGCGCPVNITNYTYIEFPCENGKIILKNEKLAVINVRGDYVIFDTIDKYLMLFEGIMSGAYVIVFSHPSLDSSYGCRIRRENYESALKLVNEFRNRGLKKEGLSYLKAFKYKNQEQRARKLARQMQTEQNLQAVSNILNPSKTPHCPKCRSTSISYDTKKLSIGRAIVGDAIAGAPGAVIGGLSSKKGYAVCLNCGKRWKI